MKFLKKLFGLDRPTSAAPRAQSPATPAQSPSPADYANALKLYTKCRADYDIAQNDIVLRGPDKSGLRQVLSALNDHISRVPDDVDALLLRAGTIETLYDKGLYDHALEDLRHVLDLTPTNARAYVIRGSILYSQCGGGFDAPPEVEEKKVRLLVADLHKALELDPQGCWDLSFSKYMRSNAGLRKELAANEAHLQKILAKRELQARPAVSQPTAQARPQPFKEVTASTADEATRILCGDALQAAALNAEPKARLAALEFAANHVVWSGPLQDLKGVVLKNARRMSSYPGFMNFQISLYENGDAAHASAIYQRGGGFTFRPLRVWKSETVAFAAGDDSFEA